ncbi:MAG: hypothetical protein RLZZ299_922 [Pseudomonadota bacterium]
MSHLLDTISFGAIVTVRDRLLAQASAGRRIYRLESGDPSFDTPPHVREAIEKALRDGHTHYTASTGIAPLRDAIVAKLRDENGLQVDHADQVVVTSGGMHALFLVFAALLDPGDEVLMPDPMWTEIAENIRLAGGVPVRVPLRLSGGDPWTVEDLESRITPRTRAIFVNTPHNPTGVVFERPLLQAIVDLAVRRNLAIVSDEAYEHVIFDGAQHVSIGALPGAADRTISLYSTSKSYAMSGLRVGYVHSRDATVLERIKKLLRCSTNGVNSIAQWGAAAALKAGGAASRAMSDIYQARRDVLVEGLSGLGVLHPYVPRGSFFLWARIDPAWGGYRGRTDDEAMTDFLIDGQGVGSAPGTAFGPGGAGHVRFAFSAATPEIEAAVAALRAMLASGA